jgi:hypothetical protein
MTHEKITPLRERMMEDMRIRGMGDKAQKSHICGFRSDPATRTDSIRPPIPI